VHLLVLSKSPGEDDGFRISFNGLDFVFMGDVWILFCGKLFSFRGALSDMHEDLCISVDGWVTCCRRAGIGEADKL